MTSKVEIANKALIRLGANTISSFSENSHEARLINSIFDSVRDTELSSHYWNFAKKRVQLAPLASTPSFGFKASYQLPSDFLTLFDIYNNSDYLVDKYELEGRHFLCDETTGIRLIYIARIDDPSEYHPTFSDALASKIAMELCESITQSNTKKNDVFNTYTAAIASARHVNAIVSPTLDVRNSEWVVSRIGGY